MGGGERERESVGRNGGKGFGRGRR